MTAPLPVITTHLLERRERGYLAWVAVANEVAELPLESAPIDGSTHALEIHVEGFAEPLVVLADPLGAPTTAGFPLRLRPLDDEQEDQLRAELFAGGADAPPDGAPSAERTSVMPARVTVAPAAIAKSESVRPLTDDHAFALGNPVSAGTKRAPGSLAGRSLGDGRFVLEQLLGGGASGEVYRAVHTALRRAVAVKILHPALQQNEDYCLRFYGEALAASRLDHRNVLRVIDYGQEPDGLLYIVMELLEGRSLQQVLDAKGRLTEPHIVELVTQACAGLAHAHDAGVVHRDIKPENIVIVNGRDDDGRETELVKVCDFGIAHWTPPASGDGEDDTLIMRPDASQVVGTPIYMSPEQIRNEKVDARTDVYSLGVVLYELATGRVPFLYEDTTDILTAQLYEVPIPPSEHAPTMSPELERITLRALAKDPAARQRDTRELRGELRRLVANDLGSSGLFRKVSVRMVALTAHDFTTDPADALGTLHDIDARDRATAYAALGDALKATLLAGRSKLARTFASWLEARLADPGLPEPERVLAQGTLNVLRDPEVVRAFAADLLNRKIERTEDAIELLRTSGPLAARAAIDARRRAGTASLELRGELVTILRAIGTPALSAIVSTLESIAGLASRQEEALAEDLLRSLPKGRFDAAGHVTVRFVRLDKPSLGLTALRATTLIWEERAQPLLVGVLDGSEDGFRLLAIEQLERLGAIDELVVDRLGRLVTGQNLASEDVKLAAAAALAAARPEAQSRTVAFLVGRLAPAQGLMGSIRSALASREEPKIMVALARSLFKLEPDGSRGVLERLALARPELRAGIEAVLAGR